MRIGDVDDRMLVVDPGIAVAILVEHCPEEIEPLRAAMPHDCAVVADPAPARDHVDSAHDGSIRADVLAYPVRIERARGPARLRPFGRASPRPPHVGGSP